MISIIQLIDGQNRGSMELDRSFTVQCELKFHLADGHLSYEVVPVKPYVKAYEDDGELLGGSEIYIAYADSNPAGQICLSTNWNAYIQDIVVAKNYRCRGIATALVKHAIDWPRHKDLPGGMLETQHNNVAACRLYEKMRFPVKRIRCRPLSRNRPCESGNCPVLVLAQADLSYLLSLSSHTGMFSIPDTEGPVGMRQ